MKSIQDIKFTEPQSMNYDKKVGEAYLEFLEKGEDKLKIEKEEENHLQDEDTLFEIPKARIRMVTRL
jgi:hypothetical protein